MQNVQMNLAAEMQFLATELISINNRLAIVVAMYTTENMASLADADYAALPELSHATVAEMNAAKNAFSEVKATMGDYIPGSVVTRLMKIVSTIPK